MNPFYAARIRKSLDYIEENLDKLITLEDIASRAHYSPYHFHRLFSEFCGETPGNFINRIRLEKAAWLLVHCEDLTITDVLFKLGYSSPQAFSRAFRQFYNVPPREYRVTYKTKATYEKNPHFFDSLEITIKRQPSVKVACIDSMKGYDSDLISSNWERLLNWAHSEGIDSKALKMGISYDDPEFSKPHKNRHKVCIEIPETLEPPPDMGSMRISDTPIACLSLKGYPKDVKDGFMFMYNHWLPKNSFYPSIKPPFEAYRTLDINGINNITLCIPIRKHSKIC